MSENLERREDCENECKLKKLPLFPVNFNKSKKEKKIGEVVNSHIEETKEDIRKQKEELRKNYNP